MPADAEPASEFRYRNPVIEKDCLYIAVSQSGETADTLAAVHEVQRKGGRVLGVVNAVGSSIARACDGGIYIHAGPEVSVASTKTFTCTLVCLRAAGAASRPHPRPLAGGRPAADRRPAAAARPDARDSCAARRDPRGGAQVRAAQPAPSSSAAPTAIPVALEGAQKLKEIAYVHAEAYPCLGAQARPAGVDLSGDADLRSACRRTTCTRSRSRRSRRSGRGAGR